MSKVYIGKIFNPQTFDSFDLFVNGYLIVTNGKITEYGQDASKWEKQRLTTKSIEVVQLEKNQFLMPGFVDCHTHGPQFPQIGLGMDLPLLEWLNRYTFPLESNFHNESYASLVYREVVKNTIRHGTTLASYFGTNHRKGTIILAKEAAKQGQRALIGKVCSDQNCPSYYVENTNESLVETEIFVKQVKELNNILVKPILTPRFAVSCSMELMKGLSRIASTQELHIQSHISENLKEIMFVKQLFNGKSYAQVYQEAGLLTSKTIMAHAVHLEDSELDLLASSKTSVAHCPNSNINLSSGNCDLLRILSKGIKAGLGTDVSGGCRPSILDSILRTMDVSHQLQFSQKSSSKIINFKNALFLATLGGAEALAMENVTGNFKEGKSFDALLIDIDNFPIVPMQIKREEISDDMQFLEMVQKFVYTGDDRNIMKVFVEGVNIKKL